MYSSHHSYDNIKATDGGRVCDDNDHIFLEYSSTQKGLQVYVHSDSHCMESQINIFKGPGAKISCWASINPPLLPISVDCVQYPYAGILHGPRFAVC